MAFEYIFTSLPSLPEKVGSKPGISVSDMARMLDAEGGVANALGRMVFLQKDIKVLEMAELGCDVPGGALFSADALRERSMLPAWLASLLSEGLAGSEGFGFDKVWRAYFRRAVEAADAAQSSFLRTWLRWDVGLTCALAAHRASRMKMDSGVQSLGIEGTPDPSEYRAITESLVSIEERDEFNWKETDLLVAGARLSKARSLAPVYTFDLDELMGYAAQLMVLSDFEYLGSKN